MRIAQHHDSESSLNSKVILIANDQEWTARSLESVLAPHGYEILRAFTGQQALDRARSGQPALILLDAQLPDIHGFDVCRTLRERSQRSVPGYPSSSPPPVPPGAPQKLEATRAGAWDFFGQPLDGELVLAKVETFLRAADALRAIRAEALLHETVIERSSGLSPHELTGATPVTKEGDHVGRPLSYTGVTDVILSGCGSGARCRSRPSG